MITEAFFSLLIGIVTAALTVFAIYMVIGVIVWLFMLGFPYIITAGFILFVVSRGVYYLYSKFFTKYMS